MLFNPATAQTTKQTTANIRQNLIGVGVNQSIPFCQLDKLILLSKDDVCSELANKPKSATNQSEGWHVLIRRAHLYDFQATLCETSKIIITKSVSLSGQQSANREERAIPTTREECQAMLDLQSCYGKAMTCLGDTCEYWKEPETTFTWLYTDVQETNRFGPSRSISRHGN